MEGTGNHWFGSWADMFSAFTAGRVAMVLPTANRLTTHLHRSERQRDVWRKRQRERLKKSRNAFGNIRSAIDGVWTQQDGEDQQPAQLAVTEVKQATSGHVTSQDPRGSPENKEFKDF